MRSMPGLAGLVMNGARAAGHTARALPAGCLLTARPDEEGPAARDDRGALQPGTGGNGAGNVRAAAG